MARQLSDAARFALTREPLICSQGGVPYNKPHLDARDAVIDRLSAEVERLRGYLKEISELKPEDMPHGDTHLAAVLARSALAAYLEKHL